MRDVQAEFHLVSDRRLLTAKIKVRRTHYCKLKLKACVLRFLLTELTATLAIANTPRKYGASDSHIAVQSSRLTLVLINRTDYQLRQALWPCLGQRST